MKKVDWEAEIACVISKRGKRIKAERALDHVAGWMTTNDVSARDLQIRTDRPGLRSDWLNGKSHDKFAPMGPYPRAARLREGPHEAVHPPHASTARSSRTATPRSSSSRPRSRSNTPPTFSALETGDIFVCGTCGGVGQGTHTFINVGDVMETEVEGLGKMTQKFVARGD